MNWADRVNFAGLPPYEFSASPPDHYLLSIAGEAIKFPKTDDQRKTAPNAWIEGKHRNGRAHEPGLIAWLFVLGEALSGRKVRFYDVGSLYGYFTALGAVAFPGAKLTAVEGHPVSAAYINDVVKANGLDATVRNAVVGTATGRKSFSVHGMEFHEGTNLPPRGGFIKRLFRRSPRSARMDLDEVKLSDLLAPTVPGSVDVLKLDTEGHQAVFLPPCTDELIERGAIVLMELDAPERLARFGPTNQELCEPFVRSGYSLFWMDHREAGNKAVHLSAIGAEHEHNSLAVLLPPAMRSS